MRSDSGLSDGIQPEIFGGSEKEDLKSWERMLHPAPRRWENSSTKEDALWSSSAALNPSASRQSLSFIRRSLIKMWQSDNGQLMNWRQSRTMSEFISRG